MLAERGAKVAVLDIIESSAMRVARDIPGAIPVVCDVGDSAAVDTAFASIHDRLGGMDVLVNSAGPIGDETTKSTLVYLGEKAAGAVATNAAMKTPTVNMTDGVWFDELRVILFGVFYCTRAALRTMLPQQRGAIVSLSSIHGIAGGVGLPHYSAAKAGILGFTRSVAKEVAPYGVRINAIASGYVDTPILQRLMPPALQAATAKQTPMGRLGRPEELASCVCFLASDESSFITGQTLSPNGGWLTV
jgi:3-oxoacyl-[acyl-carrier protein] reductase